MAYILLAHYIGWLFTVLVHFVCTFTIWETTLAWTNCEVLQDDKTTLLGWLGFEPTMLVFIASYATAVIHSAIALVQYRTA